MDAPSMTVSRCPWFSSSAAVHSIGSAGTPLRPLWPSSPLEDGLPGASSRLRSVSNVHSTSPCLLALVASVILRRRLRSHPGTRRRGVYRNTLPRKNSHYSLHAHRSPSQMPKETVSAWLSGFAIVRARRGQYKDHLPPLFCKLKPSGSIIHRWPCLRSVAGSGSA